MLLIIISNAVVNPRTVMVHLGDATLTSGAVVAIWDLYGLALFACFLQYLLQVVDLLQDQVVLISEDL